MMLHPQQFFQYLKLLGHPNKRRRIDALQDLFFLLLHGTLLHPDQWERILPVLIQNIEYGQDATLRRWGYQVGSFSMNNNKAFVDYCMDHLEEESDPENRSWIAAILSKNLSPHYFMKVMSSKAHRLSDENIALATYLFTEHSKVNMKHVISQADPLSLMWVASIGAYQEIAIHNRKEAIVSTEVLSRLTAETDNDEVLKHIMYAFFLQKKFEIRELYFSPYEYARMGDQQKKWFFSLIWKDTEFVRKNIDYFQELLRERHLFIMINPEVRIGLARGLAGSEYIPEISGYIAEWYSHEDNPSILDLLYQYIQANQDESQDFHDIVTYRMAADGVSMEPETMQAYEEKHRILVDTVNIFMKEEQAMKITKSYIGQVNEFQGNNSYALQNLNAADYQKLRSELVDLMQKCSGEQRKYLEEAILMLDKKDEKGLKAAMKQVGRFGSSVLAGVGAGAIEAYLRANHWII